MVNPTDSIQGVEDTMQVASDTEVVGEGHYALLLERPQTPVIELRKEHDTGISWVLGGLILLFLMVAVRYRSNSKFAKALLRETYEVRERGNVFDDTVRETSFLILLNLLWCGSAGVLLAALTGGVTATNCGICAAVAIAYVLFMLASYSATGNIFTDARYAGMWVRAYLSGQGLSAAGLFPMSLLAICYPAETPVWLVISGVVVGFAKIIFICKGMRIFFGQSGSWLLFLYYLCSLEIIPLILAYVSAEYLTEYVAV